MGIRKGAEDINKRNKEVAKRTGQSNIPELLLSNDGDQAIIRILSDEPLDVDFHQVYDKAIGSRPMYFLCEMEEKGSCENHEYDLTRMFMFWVWVHKILHTSQDEDKKWEKTIIGSKTYYAAEIEAPMLLRRKFGRGGELWSQFEGVLDNFGTWKDREYAFRRKGAAKDISTTYSLTPLDKSPLPVEISTVVAKLPSLESVARGLVTRLDLAEAAAPSAAPAKKKTAEQTASAKPKTVIELPADNPDIDQ